MILTTGRRRFVVFSVVLVLFSAASFVSATDAKATIRPPQLIQPSEPLREHAYKDGEDVTMRCQANPESRANYTWKKDGEIFSVSGPNVLPLPDQGGSFLIKNPTQANEGTYQCFVSNALGTAVTVNTTLRRAVLEPFPTVTRTFVHRATVGAHLVLQCHPPKSYPTGNIYWGISRPGSNQLKALDNNARVVLSYEGNLYFANVQRPDELEPNELYVCVTNNEVMRANVHGDDQKISTVLQSGYLYFANVLESDAREGDVYVCIVNNPVMKAYVQGEDQRVEARVDQGSPQYIAPHLLWSSPLRDTAIRGQNKKLKCIFAGLPTPEVTWERVGQMAPDRLRVTAEGHGTEIEIERVEFDDQGQYRCSAKNRDSGPQATHTVQLDVDSAPYWRNNRAPADVEADEEEDVEIECQSDGRPKPDIVWWINGSSITEARRSSRRHVDGNKLKIVRVAKKDQGMYQCTATNVYGSILANVFLSVQAIAPSFTATPSDTKIVEGQSTRLKCSVFGAPRPKVSWMRGTPAEAVTGDRFVLHSNGDLEIKSAALSDASQYHCVAVNKFGNDTASCRLTVRQPTTILTSPISDVIRNATDDVRIPCDVITDPAERSNLAVTWYKNDVLLRPDGRSVLVDGNDFSLTLKNCKVLDTAVYKCNASNGLDSAISDPTRVTIRDRPGPPKDVRIATCTTDYIEIMWRPADDNNLPVLEYIVYHSDSSSNDSTAFIESKRVPTTVSSSPGSMSNYLRTTVHSNPWTTYSFKVVAVNALGPSDPATSASDGTKATCSTPASAPRRNPRGVCSRMERPTQLVIVWEPMPRQEHNGEGFHYRIGYRQLVPSATMSFATVTNPSVGELVIYDQKEVFQKYEIFVQAVNRLGEAPILNGERRIGYSGEGKPLDAPRNLQLREHTLNSTYAEFNWEAVSADVSRIRGFFRGYRLQYWREVDQPRVVRHSDVILGNSPDLCPELPLNIGGTEPKRRRRASSPRSQLVIGAATDLWPFSDITAAVLVLNQANEGVLSQTITFRTPEGVPDAVTSLTAIETGSSHLTVRWSPPVYPNGVLQSYLIQYQVGPPNVGGMLSILVDSSVTTRRLYDLEPNTLYRVTVTARTETGLGVASTIESKTRPVSNPDAPEIGRIHAGDDSANVSWSPSSKPSSSSNPGSRFYVEYGKVKDIEAKQPWNRTEPDFSVAAAGGNWAVIDNLTPGEKYYFRVVAVSGTEPDQRETPSHPPRLVVIGSGRDTYDPEPQVDERLIERRAHASASWYIILICIIAFLLLILIIACIVQRSRGQIYPVFEKERTWGHDPNAPDDAPFNEYTRNNEPSDIGRSQGSLDSDDKPIDSETDSLGEYEDQDPSKFNEDGSFIGQYQRRNNQQNPRSPGAGQPSRSPYYQPSPTGQPPAGSYNTFV